MELDANLDRRLVATFLGRVLVLITHRHRNHGLLLSELGGYLLSPEQAPASTKRVSNLLRSKNWSSQLIERFLWERADHGETVLAIWDESVLEKPESLHLDG